MPRLPFEDPDPSFIPLAARRALDLAGLRLSLRAWQGLSLLVRETLARLGESPEVDPPQVHELLTAARPEPEPESIAPRPDPPADAVPAVVRDALGRERPLDDVSWRGLSAVERYALASYASRGRTEKLTRAYDALFPSRS